MLDRPSPSLTRRHKMRFGAELTGTGVRFKLWAPLHKQVSVRIEGRRPLKLVADENGWHRREVEGVGTGALYKFVLADGTEIPDPGARFLPADVHGPSEVIDPEAYDWRDGEWAGRPWEEAVIYELHVGTFTPEGTFLAAIGKLDHLAALGVTAIEVLPVADFRGAFNWGYDGVALFAPDSTYGRPEDFKAFVDAAHQHGLMVLLDVVYNHLGPDGNYLPAIAPIFTDRHQSPWGAGINYDDDGSAVIREMVIENAVYWVKEFNLDGLRFDAVHAINDDSPTHLLEVLSARIRAARPNRHCHLIIENARNEERWLKRDYDGAPVHYTAQWNDDVHHLLHAAATGEKTGYYSDYADGSGLLGRAFAEGFAFQGQMKSWEGKPHGQPSAGLPPTAFVSYIQNHDQIGNRIRGDRITKLAPPPAIRAITALYLLAPQVPMLFMGEEWAAPEPFPFFSDVSEELRDAVREGRRKELKQTPEPEDPRRPGVDDMVDPTAPATFQSAKLDWSALERAPHSDWLAFTRHLVALRHREIVPRLGQIGGFSGRHQVLGKSAVEVRWQLEDGSDLVLLANLGSRTYSRVQLDEDARVIHCEGTLANGLGPWTVVYALAPSQETR